MVFRTDCRYFKGAHPCKFNRLCQGCKQYTPISKKILIIKLASMGDVLRTTPLLRVLKRRHPLSYIVWLTLKESAEVLIGNRFIDEILILDISSILRLNLESYHWVISLDKAVEAAALASLVKATKKSGYGLDSNGKIFPFNKEAEYGFSLGLSDKLKFKYNKKSYQEIIFETAGFHFRKEEYILHLNKKQYEFKRKFIREKGLTARQFKIGLNTGCGSVFPYKKWTEEGFIELIEKLSKLKDTEILLLGGVNEEGCNNRILNKINSKVIDTGCHNSLAEFIAIIDCCDLLITSDTLAMHIAIALRKKVICLFGPTSPQEVELYSRGMKIVSPLDCAPCYKNYCIKNGECMRRISAQRVYLAIKKLKTGAKRA